MATNNSINTSDPIEVAKGGSGLVTITDHGILVGSGTSAITPLGVATDGQLPIGSSAADPVIANITAGIGMAVTNGAGTISLAVDKERFLAYVTTTLSNKTGDGTAYTPIGTGVLFDTQSGYNAVNGSYVVQNTGEYMFGGVFYTSGYGSQDDCFIKLLTPTSTFNYFISRFDVTGMPASGEFSITWSQVVSMEVGNVAYTTIALGGDTKTIDFLGTTALGAISTQFWGFQIS